MIAIVGECDEIDFIYFLYGLEIVMKPVIQ